MPSQRGSGGGVRVQRVSTALPVALVAAGLVGGASIAFLTTGNSTIQLAAPPQLRGRVTGLWTMAFIGSTPVGAVIIGAIAHRFGGHAGLAAGVIGCLLAIVVAITVKHRGVGGDQLLMNSSRSGLMTSA